MISGMPIGKTPIMFMATISWKMGHVCLACTVSPRVLLSASRCTLYLRRMNFEEAVATLLDSEGLKTENVYPIRKSIEYFYDKNGLPDSNDDVAAGAFLVGVQNTF